MKQVIFRNIFVHTYTYACNNNNEKIGREFEREQEGIWEAL